MTERSQSRESRARYNRLFAELGAFCEPSTELLNTVLSLPNMQYEGGGYALNAKVTKEKALYPFELLGGDFSLILSNKEEPLDAAVMGLAVVHDLPVINHLQGKRLHRTVLEGYRWRNVLIKAACHAACVAGYPNIAVLPAEKNVWYSAAVTNDLTAVRRRMKAAYDGVALSMGFTYHADKGLYISSTHLALGPTS